MLKIYAQAAAMWAHSAVCIQTINETSMIFEVSFIVCMAPNHTLADCITTQRTLICKRSRSRCGVSWQGDVLESTVRSEHHYDGMHQSLWRALHTLLAIDFNLKSETRRERRQDFFWLMPTMARYKHFQILNGLASVSVRDLYGIHSIASAETTNRN